MEKILASENDAKQYLSTIERKVYFVYAYLELFGEKPTIVVLLGILTAL